ncbi:peptidoglycan-binding protein [Streptomyces cyanogenus]|uniref:Peptidoglycan binding domain protein n=1 Tax=Streptomyces cyanogenus TaxID=80860 RepID=A0ABX7U122_STRCY|nr:peptidoglycan-binding domain-containing protein [Streptomyces cyanogenus]QTE02728.1 Putative peptidoglycan binding domain protein [Streptomyces cyanogenus]
MPTPPDPEQPPPGQVLEPVRVLRPRRFDALAELMREFRPDPVTYEPLGTAPGPHGSPARTAHPVEADTQELPPVPTPLPATARRPASPRTAAAPAAAAPGPGPGLRRAAVAVAVAAAALVGFGCALLLPGRQQAAATADPSPPATAAASAPASAPSPTASAPPSAPTTSAAPTAATDPDGPGTLRQGDTGPEVTDLQQRLLRIPDVYRDGSTSGTYDATLTEAVARFQLWYGISGDETGVYGNDTRRALESRTGFGDDA